MLFLNKILESEEVSELRRRSVFALIFMPKRIGAVVL